MKFLLASLFSLFAFLAGRAQESWTISLNKKVLLKDSVEKMDGHVITVKVPELKKTGHFVVEHRQPADWKKVTDRFLGVYTVEDEELVQKMSSTLVVSNKQILSLLKKHKKLVVYTWTLPKDPDLRSRVRVRRIHLCTLVLQ